MLRLGFLGAGDVAARDYLPEAHRLGGIAELTAICSRSGARARDLAERYGFATVHADLGAMLADATIDAVVNLTPIPLHAATNRAILVAGKHLYSEKPLAGTLAEARELAALAEARGLMVVAAPCVAIWPQIRMAGALLADGAIGGVYSARGLGFGGVPPWRGYPSDPGQFFEAGGGPQRDMGVYPLHGLTALLGPALRVMAMAGQAQRSFVVPDGPAAGRTVTLGEPDNWHIMLDFGGGRLASVEANNCAQDSRAPQLELMGLAGTIALDILDVAAPVALLRDGVWEERAVPQTGRAGGPDHMAGVIHLAESIASGAPPTLSIGHAAHIIEILELAARSATDGRAYALTTATV